MRLPRPFNRTLPSLLLTLLFVFAISARASADVVYTFEAPIFAAGQTTPLLSRAPNVPDPTVPGFLTTFTSSPSADGFQILPFAPIPLFSGLSLLEPAVTPTADTLTLTFSMPVFGLVVDFAMNVLPTAPAGSFTITTPTGGATVPSGVVGGAFQGGTLTFLSSTPFLTVSFIAQSATGARVEFAIDDLRLITQQVPEPATLLLVGTGAFGLLARRWRRSV